MLFKVLKKLDFDGTLEIIDSKNKKHKFGNSNPIITIRLTNKSVERKLFFNPNLYLGEAYMNEELILERGSIDEFLQMITKCYDNFIYKSDEKYNKGNMIPNNFTIFKKLVINNVHIYSIYKKNK